MKACCFVTTSLPLYRPNESSSNDCDVWCILSLPQGTFVNAGAGVKTNLLFFTKGTTTEKIWYYDLAERKVGKKNPLSNAISRSSSPCFHHEPTANEAGPSPAKKSRRKTTT